MRWFVTIDGSECADPAPIDGVLYNNNSLTTINIHRGTTITGICNQTVNGTITGAGTYEAMLNVGMCEGFNETYNAFTGFQGVSTMYIEEMPRREWRGREGGRGVGGVGREGREEGRRGKGVGGKGILSNCPDTSIVNFSSL